MLYQIPHTCVYNSSNEHMRYIKNLSHPPPKYAWCFSHPPLSVESPASGREIRVLREAVLARGDRQSLYDKLAISNTYSHTKKRNDLRPITLSKMPFPEVGFSAVAILGGGWLQSPASDGPPCYWWCTKHAQLIMGTWPIYKKHFLQLILTKKNLSFDKISPRDFYFFPFFSICTCMVYKFGA